METIVSNDNGHGRIDALDDDIALGKLEYEITESNLSILHTYTFKGYEGKGVGKALVEAAIAEAQRQKVLVNPVCSFAQAYFDRHKDLQHLLANHT